MRVKSGDNSSVTLLPLNVTMEQSPDMTLFIVTKYVLVNAESPQTGIRMTITLKRKIMSEMMTTYFPSLLLMMITYATTFFKPFFFEAALSVNITTMLVMTTIFISKMDGLPPTSAIKMIDIWLIMCQLVPFCEVVLLTAIEYNSGGEQDANGQKSKTINHHGKMRVIKLDDENDSTNEKPENAWSEEDKNKLECLTAYIPSLKSIRKYLTNGGP